MKTFIYCIERIETGKKYIGQHRGDIEDNYWGSGVGISNAIKKYGKDKFKKYVLEYCDLEDLNDREIYWINQHNTFLGEGYNRDDGGKSNSGYWATRTDEEKAAIHQKRLDNRPDNFKEIMNKVHKTRNNKAISEKLKGRVYSKETIEKMSKSATGKKQSKETIDKRRKKTLGLKRTPEQCANISKATIGKKKPPKTEEHKKKLRKPVNQYDLKGNFIKTHDGVSLAGKELKIDYSGISGCASGKLKTSGGFIWKWVK